MVPYENVKTLVLYVASLCLGQMTIHWVQKVQIVLLIAKKVIVSAKYSDFTNVLLNKSAIEFFECFIINKYLLNLELCEKISYKLI